MTSLFIDSTNIIQIALISDNGDWIGEELLLEKKNSSVTHQLIYKLLQNYNLDISQIKNVFQVAGPGSYTGIRLSQGISQILEYLGKQVFSFYHFEVPLLLDFKEGYWIDHAYKGEVFVHAWNHRDSSSGNQEVIKLGDFKQKYKNELSETPHLFFANSPYLSLQMEEFFCIFQDHQFTSELIKLNAKKIFPHIEKLGLKNRPFYYRPLELEFKKSVNI